MKTLQEIEKMFKDAKINVHFNYAGAANIQKLSDGKMYKTIYLSKYTHADRAIELLKSLGHTIEPMFGKERGINLCNAYFKYSVTFNIESD